jgi:hypothetical protein
MMAAGADMAAEGYAAAVATQIHLAATSMGGSGAVDTLPALRVVLAPVELMGSGDMTANMDLLQANPFLGLYGSEETIDVDTEFRWTN